MATSSGLRANGALAISRKLLQIYMEEAAATLTRRREIVGGRIREARKHKALLQKQLATRVRVEPQTVSNWERGVSTPDLDKVELLAQVLERPVSWFFGAEPEADASPSQAATDAQILAKLDQVLDRLDRLESRSPAPPVAPARRRASR